MTTEGLIGSLGTELVWQVLLAGFAAVLAVGGGVALLGGRRPAPAALLAGALVAVLGPSLLGRACLWDLAAADPERLRLQATTFGAVHLLAPLSSLPALGLGLLFHGFVGARARPRAALPAVAGGIAVAGCAVGVALAGWWDGNPIYPLLRAAAYLLFGSLAVAGATGGGGEAEGGREAGVAAACALPLGFALGEASQRGLVIVLLVRVTAAVPHGAWDEGLSQMLAAISLEWAASRIGLALACLGALPASLRAGRGGVGAWALAVAASWALLLGSDLGPLGSALARLVP